MEHSISNYNVTMYTITVEVGQVTSRKEPGCLGSVCLQPNKSDTQEFILLIR